MSFASPLFFLYLFSLYFFFSLVFFTVSSKERRENLVKWLLLIGSYLFYATWSVKYLFLIFVTTASDYFLAKKIFSAKSLLKKKHILFLSLSINLGILFFFKYFNFFQANLLAFSQEMGLNTGSISMFNVVLPVGISFYTFQSLSYTIDVYRGIIVPEKKFWNYALYLSFFPQLVAGPIVTAKAFLPQLHSLGWDFPEIQGNRIAYFLLLGFVKKVVFADRLAVVVDSVYSYPAAFSWISILIGVIAYSLQIYSDFSGYSDIARGSALMFGIELPENFNLPYTSTSFSEFWRRWHISLSLWLKNYLYIPLGGNRRTETRTRLNLMVTMCLGGLWHGASWNFILWGLMHGFLLGLEKFLIFHNFHFAPEGVTPAKHKKTQKMIFFGKWALVNSLVVLLWIPFRSPDLSSTWTLFSRLFSFADGFEIARNLKMECFAMFFVFGFVHVLARKYAEKIEIFLQKDYSFLSILISALISIVILLLSKDSMPFIYFVF